MTEPLLSLSDPAKLLFDQALHEETTGTATRTPEQPECLVETAPLRRTLMKRMLKKEDPKDRFLTCSRQPSRTASPTSLFTTTVFKIPEATRSGRCIHRDTKSLQRSIVAL